MTPERGVGLSSPPARGGVDSRCVLYESVGSLPATWGGQNRPVNRSVEAALTGAMVGELTVSVKADRRTKRGQGKENFDHDRKL